MPGTPPTAPRTGAPRYDNADAANFAPQVNAITDNLDAKVVLAAENRTGLTAILSNKLLVADAQPSFRLSGNGLHEWGAGGASAPDAILYRSGVSQIKTDGNLQAGGDTFGQHLTAYQVRIGNTSNFASVAFGSALDTNLYRSAAGVLKTDGLLRAGSNIVALDGAAGQVTLYAGAGTGGVTFGVATDTNLYRSAAGVLKTDGLVELGGGSISVALGAVTTARGIFGNGVGPGNEVGIRLGGDTNLYRNGANTLRTDGAFSCNDLTAKIGQATEVRLTDITGRPAVVFGSAQDTNLIRDGVAFLRTNATTFVTAGRIISSSAGQQVNIGQLANGILFGSAEDTNLYRSAAGLLKTDGAMHATTFRPTGNYIQSANGATRIKFDDVNEQIALTSIGGVGIRNSVDTTFAAIRASSFDINSDRELKKNITGMTGALDTIRALRGVTFEWKHPDSQKGVQRGFIAQEVAEVMPDTVSTMADGTFGISPMDVIPVLVEAVKELAGQVAALATAA